MIEFLLIFSTNKINPSIILQYMPCILIFKNKAICHKQRLLAQMTYYLIQRFYPIALQGRTLLLRHSLFLHPHKQDLLYCLLLLLSLLLFCLP